jgi:ABC-type antimicrobial peptide transport system permease subunit
MKFRDAHAKSEFAWRLAHPANALKVVLRQGIVLAIIGAAIGIGVALGVTRYLTSMLYDVHPTIR